MFLFMFEYMENVLSFLFLYHILAIFIEYYSKLSYKHEDLVSKYEILIRYKIYK
jgi:hypothetical protein